MLLVSVLPILNRRTHTEDMPPGTASESGGELPPTCSVRDWTCFCSGFHKNDNYTPEMVNRVPQNFALGLIPEPTAKIGHDKQQRFAKSLGFPNVGRITKCEPAGNGLFKIQVDNVPTAVGQQINGGWLNSGSVELLPRMPDPRDPAKTIEGPILTGVSFLGEEQPAVKGLTKPHATFADGREVPPATDPAEWLSAMAEVTRKMAAEAKDDESDGVWVGGKFFATQVISFSEMTAMNPEAEKKAMAAKFASACKKMAAGDLAGAEKESPGFSAKFAAFSASEGFSKAFGAYADAPMPTPPTAPVPGAPGAMAAPPVPPPDPTAPPVPGAMSGDYMSAMKKFADDPAASPEMKQMASMFASFAADCTKRMGAMEAEKEAEKTKANETQMAQMSAMIDKAAKEVSGRITPYELDEFIKPQWLNILTVKKFSNESDRMKEFADSVDFYKRKPLDRTLLAAPTPGLPVDPATGKPPVPGKRMLTPLQQIMVGSDLMKRYEPVGRRLILESAVGATG